MIIKTKDVANWTDEELTRWANGEVCYKEDTVEQHSVVAAEVVTRLGVDEATVAGVEDLVAWAKASWLADPTDTEVTDPEATPSETTAAEVTSGTTETTEAAGEVSGEPVVGEGSTETGDTSTDDPEAPPTVEGSSTTEAPAVKDEVARVQPTTTDPVTMAFHATMKEYVDRMRPGVAHGESEGAMLQVKLYRTIQSVLRQKGAAFNKLYGELLSVVNANRNGCFNERYLFRYFTTVNLPAPERKNFERILNLIITTCDPATRTVASKQVDIDATMEGFKDSEMHQRVIAFYTQL